TPMGKPYRPRTRLLGLRAPEFAEIVPRGGRWRWRRAVLSQREPGAARSEPRGGRRSLLSSPYRAPLRALGCAGLLLPQPSRSAAGLERAQHVIDWGNADDRPRRRASGCALVARHVRIFPDLHIGQPLCGAARGSLRT